MTVNDGQVTVGPSSFGINLGITSNATGSLLIENAGTVALAGGGLSLGFGSASSGTVTVTGAGSKLTDGSTNGYVTIGGSGDGALTVSNGGSFAMTGTAGLTIGSNSGSASEMTVSGGTVSVAATAGGLFVGGGGAGTLTVENSGSVGDGSGLTVGSASGADGVLSIGSGGTVTAAQVNAGQGAGSSGIMSVLGTGSDLGVTGSLNVGESGSGLLDVSQGATVTAASLDIGQAGGGSGVLSVSGSGSTLTTTGSLVLGAAGAGEFSILGGAQVTIGTGGVVGSSKTAPGNLDVEGAGSQITISTGTLTVGANGPAEFTLGIGATSHGEIANGPFGVVNEYGNVDPATDPNDGTQNVGFGNSLIYDYYIANSGTIKITSGTASFFSPLVTDETNAADGSTSGLWVIGAHETLVMNTTSVDNTQTFDFTSPSAATLVIGQVPQGNPNDPDTFNGQTMPTLTGSIAPGSPNVLPGWDAPIENFQVGDLIVLRGLTYGSATASGDVVTIWSQPGGLGNALGSLTFLSKSGAASPTEAAAAAVQINSLACFAAGTRIGTADGPVAVERLHIGDKVATDDGRCEPIVWIGSRAVDCARHPRPETVRPVRIAQGTFGENVPARDLYLSPDHAVFLNGVLIPVKLLINGSSIVQVRRTAVTYYHIELPEHAIILAERLRVESYLDTGDRLNFAGGGTIRLHPDFAARLAPETAMTWETRGAARLVMNGPELQTARRMIAATPRGQMPRAVRRTQSA